MGLPDSVASVFSLLEQQGVLDSGLAARLRRMVGFRNIAVHNYQNLNPEIVEAIVTRHLDDLRSFSGRVVQQFGL